MTTKQFLRTLRQAFKAAEHDYTQGDLATAVILLSVPMILELALESVFAVVDMLFVSRLGQNAIATVGMTESLISIVYSIAIGLSAGTSAIVARRVGERNSDGAAHAGAQSIAIGFVASIIMSVVGIAYADEALRLMGATPEVVSEGAIFARIQLGGNLVVVLLFLINGIFRGAGDAGMAMRSLWIASGVNIVLCPLLIPSFGLTGAAIATVVGRSSGVVYQAFHMIKGDGTLRFLRRHFNFDFPIVRSVLSLAWPATFQFLLGSGGWIVLTRFVAQFGGTASAAGYQIAVRSFMFFMLPAWGISNAAATLVGQNLGAKQIERAEQSTYKTAQYSATLMAIVTLLFIVLAEPIIGVFTREPDVFPFATAALRILAAGYVFFGIGMVLSQAMNGAGDTKTPTWLNFVCFWLFQNPLAYILATTAGLGATGVVWSIPAAQVLYVALAWWLFKRGRWKRMIV